ncbi:MAG: hypothetical protein ACPL1K_06220, partial [Candidatus Kryptoniota bacterium]
LTGLMPQKASPRKLLALTRQYWGIESGLHYRRDVTLHEDATRLTVGAAGHNMAILNNLPIGLCLRNGLANLAKARRLVSAQPKYALQLIVSSKKILPCESPATPVKFDCQRVINPLQLRQRK